MVLSILDFSWISPKWKFHFYHYLWEVSDIIYIHKSVFSTVKWSYQDLWRGKAEGSKNTRLVCKPKWGVGEHSARGQLDIKAHNSSTFSGLILPLKYHLFQQLHLSTTPLFLVFLTLTLPVRLTVYLMLIWGWFSSLTFLTWLPVCCVNCFPKSWPVSSWLQADTWLQLWSILSNKLRIKDLRPAPWWGLMSSKDILSDDLYI